MAAARALRLVPVASILSFFIFFVSSSMADDLLKSGDSLQSGQSLDTGPYTLIMQNDCNLVLYDGASSIWASNTGGSGSGCRCTLLSVGNLVIYNSNSNVVWSSKTSGQNGHYVLALQDDRNLVIYGGVTWATGTNKLGK